MQGHSKVVLGQPKANSTQAEARLRQDGTRRQTLWPLVKDRAISQEEYDDAVQANLEAQAGGRCG